MLAEVGPLARQAGVRIDVEEPVPDLRVDAARVELILLNLVGNAIKYSDPAQPVRWVRVDFQGQGRGWSLEVSDNGLGIPAQHHAHVFDRAFRAHPDRADGTGMGLAMVREAARQLGASICFRSEPGAGSTFRLELQPPAEAPLAGEARPGGEGEEPGD